MDILSKRNANPTPQPAEKKEGGEEAIELKKAEAWPPLLETDLLLHPLLLFHFTSLPIVPPLCLDQSFARGHVHAHLLVASILFASVSCFFALSVSLTGTPHTSPY